MLNQLVLVGRLTKDIEIEKIDDDKEMAILNLAVPRSYKNADGEYDTDFIVVTAYGMIACNTKEYCQKGDLIGIKGKVESDKNGAIRLVAEKVTFLSSSKKEEE